MFRFSDESRNALDSCDYRLVQVAERAIQIMDFKVLEGHRNKETQNRYYEKGTSTLRWPDGKHNRIPSLAMDVAPYPIDWSNHPKAISRFYLLAGVILAVADELGVKLRWGGDWDGDWDLFDQNFDDLGHFEIVEE